MTRNLYLGADVGVALGLLPDFPAAAQFMWDQMKDTRFDIRAQKLAGESALLQPDLIAIQEATKWTCKKRFFSKKKVVFDFLEMFLAETRKSGVSYSLIESDGTSTLNPGFSIPAIPKLTMVKDPEIFEEIFGEDQAACGFTIADALLIRDDSSLKIIQAGNSEYREHYSVIPLAMEIYRGYTWADIIKGDTPVRVVATHLESLFSEGGIPHSALQARQLIKDLESTRMPIVVMGDFNADPRDPRPKTSANPGGQPVANESCAAQSSSPSTEEAEAKCNAYWLMRKAGFIDAGPDSLNPKNFTWGAAALLNGPDKERKGFANNLGNKYGFTDRLDYIFTKNGISPVKAQLLSNTWPQGPSNWICEVDFKDETCLPSDHAGVFAILEVEVDGTFSAREAPLPDNRTLPIPTPTLIFYGILLLLVLFILWLPYRLILKPLVIRPLTKVVTGRRKEIENASPEKNGEESR
jgi:endonuclease/exonuclease/phosphatase family metal-dependent hydrolase